MGGPDHRCDVGRWSAGGRQHAHACRHRDAECPPRSGTHDARRRLWVWAVCYLPAELLGTLVALGAAWTAHAASGSMGSAAVAGTVGEALGFYGCVAVREARDQGPARPWPRDVPLADGYGDRPGHADRVRPG